MNNHAALLEALQARIDVVADQELRERDAAAHLAQLKAAAAHLDIVVSRLPEDCNPQLRHFLERQSYLKAIDWLKTHKN